MNNRTKTILCASVIVAMLTVMTTVDVAEGKKHSTATHDKHDKKIKADFAEIDKDIKDYVKTDMKDPHAKKDELKAKHSEKLDKIISEVGKKLNTKYSDYERKTLKDLIVREHISETFRQQRMSEIPEDSTTVVTNLDTLSTYEHHILPAAYATDDNPYPIKSWKQVAVDRFGGSGSDGNGDTFDIDGDNQLFRVTTVNTTDEVLYTLEFLDEDHPNPIIDRAYDVVRIPIFLTTTDIEFFTVDKDGVHFYDIWSDDYKFAYFWGNHAKSVQPYSEGMTIFVSNTWNHSMGIENNNSDMDMIEWTLS